MLVSRPLAAVLLAVASAPVAATFHLMSIREVYVGPAADPNAQYVELQMYAAGQDEVQGHSLTFYGPTGNLLGTLPFPANVPNGATQSYILVATDQAVTRFGVAADLTMTPLLTPAGGKVCFADVDCFSWGNYTGESIVPSPSGNPFNPAMGLAADSAARRDSTGGTSATMLDANDDTDDSAADFDVAAAPAPTNNSSAPDPDPCPSYGCDGGSGGGSGGYGSGGAQSLIGSLGLLLMAALRRRALRPA